MSNEESPVITPDPNEKISDQEENKIPAISPKARSPKKKNKTAHMKQFFIYFRELLLGRTKKQTQGEKLTFLGKRMIGILFFFLLYSFVFFVRIGIDIVPDSFLDNLLWVLAFGDREPYILATAVTLTFIFLSLFCCNEKFLGWFFGKLYLLKHLIFIAGLTFGNYFLAQLLNSSSFELYSFLLILAMIWLIFQSNRIYSAARAGATKIEKRFSENYSPFLYFLAFIIPFIIIGSLFFLTWIIRYGTVRFTLDILARNDANRAFTIYSKEMNEIFPLVYFGLFLVAVFLIIQITLSRKKGSTKRAGVFDFFTFGLISFVMLLYAIYNIILYLYLDSEFLAAISDWLGSESSSSTFFILEFLIAILFLLWIVYDIRKQFKKGVFFFTTDGLVFFLMAMILAQTTARLGLVTDNAGQVTALREFIQYDYIVLPYLILAFLGFSVLMYWIKPQQFSMFMHMNEAAIRKEDKSMDVILSFLKREFIRRGERLVISNEIVNSLMQLTGLGKGIVMSLIHRLDKHFIDVQIYEEENVPGNKVLYFDFIPITKKYQKSKAADDRAKKFLQDQFSSNIQKDQRKRLNLAKGPVSSSKQSDTFIQALSVQYGRKIKDEAAILKSREDEQLIIDRAIDEDTLDLVYEIIKQEYIRRIKQVADYPEDFRFKISEISASVEKYTRITPGRLYPLLTELAVVNWNFNLSRYGIDDTEEDDDRWVEFLPISDFSVSDALMKYRPGHTKEIVVLMQTWFYRNIYHEKLKLELLPLMIYEDEEEEARRSFRSRWFANLMHYFHENFALMEKYRDQLDNSRKLQYHMRKIIKSNVERYELKHAPKKKKKKRKKKERKK